MIVVRVVMHKRHLVTCSTHFMHLGLDVLVQFPIERQ